MSVGAAVGAVVNLFGIAAIGTQKGIAADAIGHAHVAQAAAQGVHILQTRNEKRRGGEHVVGHLGGGRRTALQTKSPMVVARAFDQALIRVCAIHRAGIGPVGV